MFATASTSAALSALTLGLLLTAPGNARAQAAPPTTGPRPRWELLGSSGALVPTGALRATLKDASLSTAQLSYVLRSRLAVTTTLGWARSRDLLRENDPKLSVFTYDVGIEARAPRWLAGDAVTFTPFAGVGAGGRSYDHRGVDVDATHTLAGYVATGGELGAGRLRLRIEARDYVTGFKPLGGGTAAARNDMMLLAGLRYTRKRAID
jgi:hypothetical protein